MPVTRIQATMEEEMSNAMNIRLTNFEVNRNKVHAWSKAIHKNLQNINIELES